MAACLSRLHHISLHVSHVGNIANYLVSKLKFDLFAARHTDEVRQFAFRRGAAVFLVNERPPKSGLTLNGETRDLQDQPTDLYNNLHNNSDNGHPQGCLYDVETPYSVDTVCNVCFEVQDVERSFKTLLDQGCDLLVPPTVVQDSGGAVSYTVVKSIVGNVCHTLIDRTKYEGNFLPGFNDITNLSTGVADSDKSGTVSHFDHITYACPTNTTSQVMQWYDRCFGFKRFLLDSNEDEGEGFVLNGDGIGLRLTAMEYWKCGEAGMKFSFTDKKEPECKFVVAESLPGQGSNQLDTFLTQHGGPGIQHIGLYTDDIVSTAHAMAEAGVQFFSPPPTYYTEVKRQEIEAAGQRPERLAQHGILLDTDMRHDARDQTAENRYLLQLFTKHVFEEETFFLELIERRGASGFGEGNIRALWKAVQANMEKEKEATAKNSLDAKGGHH
ncbi:unnamed protein product [Boreogadus saida]